MKYLGHLISEDGVRPDPNNTEKVKEWPRSTIAQKIRSFLDLANYFQKIIQDYNRIVSSLTDLMRSKKIWKGDR